MPELLRAPTRPYRSAVMDSSRWDGFQPRAGDIVVATFPKCGTTWTQRIVDLLIHQSAEPRPIMETYPWLDAIFFAPVEQDLATLEAQTHRRAIKSHLPFDSLPVFEGVKYIHVARDGRDAAFSWHNHQQGFTDEAKRRLAAANGWDESMAPPPLPDDLREHFVSWLSVAEAGGMPGELPFFEYEMTYWRERRRPNLLLVHYADLKADLPGEMRRISRFLEIDTPEPLLADLAEAARFESMKAQGANLLPKIGEMFDRGHDRFLNKGTNGRWKDVLGQDDLARYAALAQSRLTPDAARWIESGRLVAGDPLDLAD
jgi:aryl sulfotransferase